MKTIFACLMTAAALVFVGCSDNATQPAPTTDGPNSDSGTPDTGSATASAETPQKVFEAFKQAVASNDWETATGYMTEESQSAMAFTMVIGSGFVAALNEDAAKQFEDLFKKHGLDPNAEPGAGEADMNPQQAMLAMTGPIKDKPKFIGEVTKLMDSVSGGSGGDAMATGELDEVQIDGDTATGMIVGDGKQEPIDFVKVDGRWKIQMPEDMLSMGGDDSSVSFSGDDFGDGWSDDEFDNWQWGNFNEPELGPAGEIPLDDFNAAWQAPMNESGVPADDLLRWLAKELKLEWVEPGEELPQLSEPVSIDVAGISKLEAADQIAQQVGLYPKYLMKKMTVAAGPRPHAVAFAGPFLVEVGAVEELVPAGATQLTLRVHAHGLSEPVISLLASLQQDFEMEDPEVVTVRITERTGTGGKSLGHPGQPGTGFATQYTTAAIQWTVPVPLLNTTNDVAGVESLKGEISFVLPTDVDTLTFEELEPGAKLTSGDATFELKSADGSVEVDYAGVDGESLDIMARDADGNNLTSYSKSVYGDGDGGTITSYFEGDVAAADVVVKKNTQRVRYSFDLHDIPLPRHTEQPETIAELNFEGDAPLAIEFVKFGKNEFDQDAAEVKLSNGSNREVHGYVVTLHYLDDSGEELDDFPFTSFGIDVPAGETMTHHISTAFKPDDTRSVRFEVSEVTFRDLTTWTAEE